MRRGTVQAVPSLTTVCVLKVYLQIVCLPDREVSGRAQNFVFNLLK